MPYQEPLGEVFVATKLDILSPKNLFFIRIFLSCLPGFLTSQRNCHANEKNAQCC